MSYYSEEIAPFVGMVDEGDAHFPVTKTVKKEKLGDFSERFWLVACHTHLPEYEKDRGSDSPPRVKFSSLAEASRIAKDMSTRYRNRFYVLETVEVCGEFTLQEYKDKRAAEALDDFLD